MPFGKITVGPEVSTGRWTGGGGIASGRPPVATGVSGWAKGLGGMAESGGVTDASGIGIRSGSVG